LIPADFHRFCGGVDGGRVSGPGVAARLDGGVLFVLNGEIGSIWI
jgi:hypothetical protein